MNKIKDLPKYNPLEYPVSPFSKKRYIVTIIGATLCISAAYLFLTPYLKLDTSFAIEGDPKLLALLGIFWLLIGLTILSQVIRAYRFSMRCNAGKVKSPSKPWKWDYNWNSKFYSRPILKKITSLVIGITFLFSIGYAVLINIEKIGSDKIFSKSIFGLLYLLFLFISLYNLFKELKFMNIKCSYPHFPIRLGENVNVAVNGLPDKKGIKNIKVSLRCLTSEFGYIVRGNAHKTKQYQLLTYEVHKQIVKTTKSQITNGQLSLSIQLPDDNKMSTLLDSETPRFWELRVEVDNTGIDFDFGFLLPIYK